MIMDYRDFPSKKCCSTNLRTPPCSDNPKILSHHTVGSCTNPINNPFTFTCSSLGQVAQHQGRQDHGDRGHGHRAAGHEGGQGLPGERKEEAGGQRNANGIVAQGKEEVELNTYSRRIATYLTLLR